ncbi:MAG: hypothetical protein P4N24_07920 [Acidobacteriota bacterium]|nr:hypothetical protein [Acidobacteriota bacterium]
MNPDVHQRACQLLDALHVEGILPVDRQWLEAHLAECSTCQGRAHANERALQALRSNTISIAPELVSITQARVRLRARELRENQVRMRALWISCGLSWLVGTLTAPLLWQAIAWIGRQFDISQAIRLMAFGICWVAPATIVGAVMAWKHSHASDALNEHEAWER